MFASGASGRHIWIDTIGNNVRVWDLPGKGTNMLPARTYIRNMGLEYFDAVLIVSDGRWTESDGRLLEAVRFAGILLSSLTGLLVMM